MNTVRNLYENEFENYFSEIDTIPNDNKNSSLNMEVAYITKEDLEKLKRITLQLPLERFECAQCKNSYLVSRTE